MNPRQHLARVMAALMVVASLLGAASPAAATTPAGAAGGSSPAVKTAQLADFGEPFHWLPPLGVESGDPSKFDGSLLDGLTVGICRVEGPACTPVKTITSASATSERLRTGQTAGKDSYYLATWDVSKMKLEPSTFRVSVTIARLQLGVIVVGPAQYKSFGRSWPIKFRVEKNPTIRVRVLHEAGKTANQIANRISLEFGICGDDLAQLLADDLDPFTAQEIDLAVAGACQAAELFPTTKIADDAMNDALASFDPTSGQMVFARSTAVLANLKAGDVLVGEPAAAAASGYLRKITAITKNKKTGVITVETTQALLNEAVKEGTLDAAADLDPADIVSTDTLPGVTLTMARPTPQRGPAAGGGYALVDVGDGFDFHETVDVTLDGSVSGGGADGDGTVHLRGRVDFNAGWNVGIGIEDCLSITLACVDRFEAHVGSSLYSDLHVDGTFNGHLQREVALSTSYFSPIVFFIGPIPVVLVPVVKAIAGINGDAHVKFSFDSQIQSTFELGAKWTDPDDGGSDWQLVKDIPVPPVDGDAHGNLTATMTLRAYAKADAKLLLYGVAGPGVAGQLGMEARVQFPGTPLWQIYGYVSGEVNFAVDLGGVLTLAEYHETFIDEDAWLAEATNQAPTCSGRKDPIPVAPNVPTFLGPRSNDSSALGFQDGYFSCVDPEGGELDPPIGKENGVEIDITKAEWASGDHDVVITVKDEAGLESDPFTLHITVVDTPPLLSVTKSGDAIPASVQLFITASAWDVEGGAQHHGGELPCAAITWDVTGGGTVTRADSELTCTVGIVFTETGYQTVTVTATEPGGKLTELPITVLVTAAPSNAAPVIEIDHFFVKSVSGTVTGCFPGPFDCHDACPSGFNCPVMMDAILFNGSVGFYDPPLTLSLDASDPNGDALTVRWYCQVGAYFYTVTDNGDGTFECNPYTSSFLTPIYIYAEVSDGTTTVRSEVRRLYMWDRLI